MEVGVCTWIFGPRPAGETARRVAALGADGVELHGALARPDAGAPYRDEGLAIFSLTPDNVDLAHPDPAVRTDALRHYAALVDFAAGYDAVVSCHGCVGRVAPLASQAEERGWLADGLRAVAEEGAAAGVPVVLEVLNRYESHLVNTAADGLALLDEVGSPNLRLLLDCYHMNIEEPDPSAAVRRAGPRLGLFHVADSNRRGMGGGHTDFPSVMAALGDTGYNGPVVIEITAPGPDPFTPVKAGDWVATLEADLRSTLTGVRALAT